MPGIAGIISQPGRQGQPDSFDAMLDCMKHESFYTSGKYTNEQLGLSVGWVAHQGSFSDCMPAWNETRDICLIFSGEHFAERSEAEALRAKGHDLNPENAGHLVHLYEEKGNSFLAGLNGWFSGLLIDLRQRKMVLFNDRYGINRIYFHEGPRGFYFSSEAKSLLKALPELRELDFRSLGEYFSCGCVLQNRTIYKGVFQLPGGSGWTFAPGQPLERKSYFNPQTWEERPRLAATEYQRQLKETWARILPRYFRGPEQVGLSLTGGLDSRMILAYTPSAPGTLPCYTFGGTYRDCADVSISRQIAGICDQPHETIPLNGSFFSEFPALAEKAVQITDGVLDVTGATDLFVHRRVRQISPVRITGLYGGEILRSLTVFKPMPQSIEHLAPQFAEAVQSAAATYAQEKSGNKSSFIAFKQAAWHIYSRLSIERTQVTIRTPYFDNDLIALAYQAPPELLDYGPALRLIAEANPGLEAVGTDRALAFKSIPGIGQLRHQIQQFTFKAEYAYDYGMPQWLAKADYAFKPFHLEKLFLGRHKYYHFRIWYRDRFAAFVKETLLDPRALARPYVRKDRLEKLVKAHTSGYGNYTLELHRLLTAELVQRTLIEPR